MKAVIVVTLLAGMSLALAAAPSRAANEESRADPLVITVHPSGIEAGPAGEETLDQKLARREKLLRYICNGCVRSDGQVVETPFRPIETLNAPQLTAATSGEP